MRRQEPILIDIREIAELLANATTAIGLGFLVVQYRLDVRERRDNERTALDEARAARLSSERRAFALLDDGYRRYLELCIAHPEAAAFEVPSHRLTSAGFSSTDDKVRFGIYCYVISLVESAYVALHDPDRATVIEGSLDQWEGWELFFRDFSCRDDFGRAWSLAGPSLEGNFFDWSSGIVAEYHGTAGEESI